MRKALIERGGGMCPMKPGNRQYLLKWCQFTQSVSFGRWEKGLFNNAFLPMQKGFLFF